DLPGARKAVSSKTPCPIHSDARRAKLSDSGSDRRDLRRKSESPRPHRPRTCPIPERRVFRYASFGPSREDRFRPESRTEMARHGIAPRKAWLSHGASETVHNFQSPDL